MRSPRPRALLASLAPVILALAACGDRGPPVWAPSPYLSTATTDGCVRARALIARAPGLLDEGRLDRAARALTRAEDLCPSEGPATWGKRVHALALLGRSAEAMQLARRIEMSDRGSEADRAAAAAARTIAEEHGRAVAAAGSRRDDPELFDPAEKRRARAADLFGRGVVAARAGDAAAAKKLFLESWGEWHPNPHALVEAGLASEALGDRVEAQKLWDRAAYDDSSAAPRPEVPALAPRLVSGAVMAWDAVGARFAIGGDEEIAVYEADLAPSLRIRTGEGVTAVAFDRASGSILAGLHGGKTRAFDAALGVARGELRGVGGITRVIAPSPASTLIALGGDAPGLRLWDASARAIARSLPSARPIVAAAWSARGDRLAYADDAGAIAVTDPATFALVSLPRARGAVRALAFEGESLHVVTAGERLRYDLERPRAPARVLGRGRADAASFTEGSRVAVLNTTRIGLEDAGASLWSVPGAEAHGGALAIAASPRAGLVAAVFRDRTVSLLRGEGPGARRDLAPASPIAAFAAAPSGKLLAAAAEDGRVLLWSIDPPKLVAFSAPGARALAFSPDTRTLAVGVERRVELRDAVTGQGTQAIDVPGRVELISFSADGMRLAVATEAATVLVYAAGGAAPVHEQRFEGGPIHAVRFAPDGKSLLVAAREGVVSWSPEARRIHRFTAFGPEPRDVVFTPDGAGMIVADKRGALQFGKAMEAPSGSTSSSAAPASITAVPGLALALATIPNGLFGTAEGDRSLTLRGPNGKLVQRFREPDAAARALAALPQGVLAASFADGALRLFRSPVTVAVAALRPIPGLPASAVAGLIQAPTGHFDVIGEGAAAARAAMRCRLGAVLFPLQVCAEQFAMEKLVPVILSGQDPAEADP